MEELIKQINKDLIYVFHYIKDDIYYINVRSKEKYKECPFCHQKSNRIHTKYIRKVQDLPIGDKKVILELETYKLKCKNDNCKSKVFSSRFSYIGKNSLKTNRLEDKTQKYLVILNSIKASNYLKNNIAVVCKSSIYNMIDKNGIRKICIDDLAGGCEHKVGLNIGEKHYMCKVLH